MITVIRPSDYNYIDKIEIDGVEFVSTYNNNYFYDGTNLILEKCTDDNVFYYYNIYVVDLAVNMDYLGMIIDDNGIFGQPSNVDFNLVGEVELDDTKC